VAPDQLANDARAETTRSHAYEVAGQAAAAAADVEVRAAPDLKAAAFFDVDNTLMRGASLFYLARGLAARRFFDFREVSEFALAQAKFVVSGSESHSDMASATEAALSFVRGRRVEDIVSLGDEIFDDYMVTKLWPGTLGLAQRHLDAGQRVWLVTATPVELASLIAHRLGFTGALGTVSEVADGCYTGKLVGAPLHGPAKAEAVRALATREGLDLSLCAAYSDSANDIPMLSLVGKPCAVNPDSTLRAHARAQGWDVRDYRRERLKRVYAYPAVGTVAAVTVASAAIALRRRRG
jgi:HAD superfamily hydrolase (TIGR01490 family)